MSWYNNITKGSLKDKSLMVIMQLILLYNTDGIENQLKNPEKVNQVQQNYCRLLHRYIKSKHSDQVTNVLFGKGLMLIHETQRVYELSNMRLKL